MIVDVHAHITPPELLERFPMPPTLGDVDGMIEQKERAGITLSIVGSPVGVGTMVPMPELDNFAQSDDDLKRFHDWLAQTVAAHRDRLRAYAWTNPFGGDALLEQTAETLKDDAFVGLIANTSVRGEYLDSSRADPLFALACECDVPILLHPPAEPVGSGSLRDFRLVEQVGRFCDVTVGITALVFGGVLERYPGLRLIAPMAGGAISLLSGRLDAAQHARRRPVGPPDTQGRPGADSTTDEKEPARDPSEQLREIFVDTAALSATTLQANLEVLGADRLLFGTDSPPADEPLERAVAAVRQLPISSDEKEQIFSGNACALFRLDAGAGAPPGSQAGDQ